jgi:hypothetical protein
MKVKGVNVCEQGPFPASDVIRVGFVCDQLACRLVDCAADQNTYGKIGCEELLSSAELAKRYTAGFQVTFLYITSNSGMINKLERMWREAVIV